jgi:serine/threonine protein kinase
MLNTSKEHTDVLEPLSPPLTELLQTHGLCSAADLRRCRRKVKRLTYDLPAFDSVWIDALVSQKSLTPFQATLLESDRPEQIAIGDHVLVDRLGGRTRSETFLARTRKRRRYCLKVLAPRPEQRDQALANLQQALGHVQDWKHPNVVVPRDAFLADEQLVVVSPYVAGLNLQELLVRRGRFPARVVRAIARQILSGLRALHKRGLVHGDIRLENVKLSPRGRALLVETGIHNALSPQLSYVTDLTGEQCDAVAPERVATGRDADERSELYSLGCLLWHLLAGRPPIKEADPLAKLTAHQQRDIPDVREWAPDVPDKLALAVGQLTKRNPAERPESFEAAAKLFGRSSFGDRKALREYQAYFLSQAPAWTIKEQSARRKLWPWLLASAASLAMLAVVLQDEGARTQLLSLADRISEQTEEIFAVPEEATEGDSSENSLLSLPDPDARGVITITENGQYSAREFSVVGPLTITADAGVEATIVCDEPFKIQCESLKLENLRFRRVDTGGQGALAVVRSLDVEVERCLFDLRVESKKHSDQSPSRLLGLAWKSLDPVDRSGGRISLRNSLFVGGTSQLYFADAPSRWSIENCLSLHGDAFARFKSWPNPERPLSADWQQFTLRETGSMLLFDPKEDDSPVSGELAITARNCVFDLQPESGALFLFHQDDVPDAQFTYLSLVGEDCVTSDSLVVAGRWDADAKKHYPLSADSLRLEGLVIAPISYAGPASEFPDGSQVTDVSGPRLSAELPGIQAERLPPADD